MRAFFTCICLLTTSVCFANTPPSRAFKMLMDGNHRFVTGTTKHPDRSAERRLETSDKQEPFAVIVGCSDSRVPSEIIFDQGIGDLFIVRVAGNVVGPLELESIEYSVLYLHSSLILVMGHQNCGAVSAVLNGNTEDIETIATLVGPAIEQSKELPGNRLENAVKTNAKMVAKELRQHPVLAKLIQEKKLDVKVGYYNFTTGEVEILQ